MYDCNKEDFISKCKEYFKTRGFVRKHTTWLKHKDDLILCFNIQTSQWDSNDFYLNVGIVIKGIDETPQTTLGKWHVHRRISDVDKSSDDILREVDLWLSTHGNMDKLKHLSSLGDEERLPVLMWKSVIEYLKTLN